MKRIPEGLHKTEEENTTIYKIVCAVAGFVIILLIAVYLVCFRGGNTKVAEVEVSKPALPTVMVTETVKEVKKEVTVDIISEELREMGELNTAEYCFTICETYSKSKPIFKVFESTAQFIYSYDGSISAGIDCDDIRIEKNDTEKIIKIVLPKSKITHIDIDKDSFQAYSEKEQLWNKLTIEDYNDSLKAFETSAKARAVDKGVLDKADENAQKTIMSLVRSLVDDDEYRIEVSTEGVK